MHFGAINDEELKTYLQQNLEFKNITDTMLKMFEGSIGKAIKIKEKMQIYNEINLILENIQNQGMIEILNSSTNLYKQKENINEILEYINVYFLEKAKEEYYNAKSYLNAIKIVEDTKKRLNFNSNYDMSIDNLLMNIWEEFNN